MPSLRNLFLYVGLLGIGLLHLSSANPIRNLVCVSRTPTLPLGSNSSALPSPEASLRVKYVAIGRGTQNYSCAAQSATPVLLGAVATLFDCTGLACISESALHEVARRAAYFPLAMITDLIPFDVLGYHYFLSDLTPTFNLSRVNNILYAKKVAAINAPANADIGPDGTGAVSWLKLDDKGGSVGVREVYRVETTGGKSPALCTSQGILTIQYSAEYWLYG